MKKAKIVFILFALFISTTNVYAETLPYDAKYGTRDISPDNIPNDQVVSYVENYVKAANHKIVKREGNKIDVLYIGYWSLWTNGDGTIWTTKYGDQTLKPFGTYTLGNTTYLGLEAQTFLNNKDNLRVSNIKIPSATELIEFQTSYEKRTSQFDKAMNIILNYGITSGTINTPTKKLAKASDSISYNYKAKLETQFDGSFDPSKPSNTGDLADGMGLNTKTVGRSLKLISSVFYAPFIITVQYDDPCNEDEASNINSPSFKQYWTPSGTASNPIYTPTKYASDCACTTDSKTPPTPIEKDFYNKMYSPTGGYYVNSGNKKGTPLLKISCPVIPEKCDIKKYYEGKMTNEEYLKCCAEPAPDFDEKVCPISQNNFNLFCNTNLTETKTFKNNIDEDKICDLCTIKCEEEGTLTFKPSQYVIAGQKLNYDFVYNTKKTCRTTYKLTPGEFTTNYNNLVQTRVTKYNDYLKAKKALDDYVSDKKCAASSTRTVYYTCNTIGTVNVDKCDYKVDYEVTTTGSTGYSCIKPGLISSWVKGTSTAPSGTASCSDGSTASYSLKTSGSAPSGTCSAGATRTVSDIYSATCKRDESIAADYNCDCANSVGLTCSAYDTQVATLTSTMNTEYSEYQTALSNERSQLTDKNSCDNYITTIKSNASFEFKIEESSFNTYTAREIEKIISSNISGNSIYSNILILSNCPPTATSCNLAVNGQNAIAYTSWERLSETEFNYTYPDEMYIDRITGKASTVTPADYYFGGYNYYTSFSTLTGRYDLSVLSNGTFGSYEQWRINNDEVACWYDLDNKLGPTKDDDNYPLYGSNGLAFRVVKLSDLFPNNRESGTNWQSAKDLVTQIESKGDSIYAGTPKYRIVITPQAMKSVRQYNEEYAYNNWNNFDFIENTTEGTSNFLKDIHKFEIKMTVNKTQ